MQESHDPIPNQNNNMVMSSHGCQTPGLKYYLKPIRSRYKAKLTKLNKNNLSSHKSKSIYGLFHKQQYTDNCKSLTDNSCVQLVYMYMSRCLPFN